MDAASTLLHQTTKRHQHFEVFPWHAIFLWFSICMNEVDIIGWQLYPRTIPDMREE